MAASAECSLETSGTEGRPGPVPLGGFGVWPEDTTIDVPPEDKGAYLTWENLSVSVPARKGSSTNILGGVTGYARPAEVLAIMGPSGCGKSILLDALAGRLTSNMSMSGNIRINGRSQVLAYGASAYVTQDDILMTTLTVRESIHYSAELQLPDSMPMKERRERAEAVMTEMGLTEVTDVRIGGRNEKGISGGQRRRVSICMEILTRPKLLFLDEPTSGLDSAAAFHVMSRIVHQAQRHGGTVIASIHQPSFEVFELFHNLCLLSSGITLYFGPISLATQFFAANGFPCPQMKNPSDHFLRIINKDFDMTKGEHAGFLAQSVILTRRSFVNMYRDPGYYWLRLVIYLALCVGVGTLYYDIGFDFVSIQSRGEMLMYIGGYLTFMAIGGFPSFVEDLKIFQRERLNGHYGAAAYTIGNTLSSAPFLLFISIIPGAFAYFIPGLQRDLQHFIYFSLVLYASMLLVEGLMMIVAALVPDFLMGIILGAGIQGGMLLASGFFRLPNSMPKPVWKYPAYYIAFHKYVCQGFYKNEFIGLTFPSNSDILVGDSSSTVSGMELLRNYWHMEAGYSKWVDLYILLGMVVLYRFMFWVTVKVGEKVKSAMIMKMMSIKERLERKE
ncbi:ABC transporter G family member 11 [Platanthera zijinensis]|uniref:ABC transporter G family member 11 n=2 Tax=Platanthera zijinensis TaxID=2320716 RepID=A0AAP0BJA6_9ASPA